MKNQMFGNTVLAGLLALCVWGFTSDVMATEDVRYCYDRSSYPTKVAVVCGSCQCPAGYY